MTDKTILADIEKYKINSETASVPWQALQRHFATGNTLYVNSELDLIDVAYQMSADNKPQMEQWLRDQLIHPVKDEQALLWIEQQSDVWAVVVKPWVLVQDQKSDNSGEQ